MAPTGNSDGLARARDKRALCALSVRCVHRARRTAHVPSFFMRRRKFRLRGRPDLQKKPDSGLWSLVFSLPAASSCSGYDTVVYAVRVVCAVYSILKVDLQLGVAALANVALSIMGPTAEKILRPARPPRTMTQWLFRPYWKRVR